MSEPTPKGWVESKTMWAAVLVLIGVVCVGLGEWQGWPDLKWVGLTMAGGGGSAVLKTRPGATQPLTLTRARARKTERTE